MAISTSHRVPLLRGRIISQRDARSGLDVGGSRRVPSPSWSDRSTATGSRCDRKIKPVTLRQNQTAADTWQASPHKCVTCTSKYCLLGVSALHKIVFSQTDRTAAVPAPLSLHVLDIAAGSDQGDPDASGRAARRQLAAHPQRDFGARHHRHQSATRRFHHQAADDLAEPLVQFRRPAGMGS
jgi:hypothetical protein